MTITLHKPEAPIAGSVFLPGSKSISNRVLMIKALSGLDFHLNNESNSDDTQHLIKALSLINSTASGTIDIGHAGTDMRFLTAYLSLKQGSFELTGSERMQQRPIKELVDVLRSLGADISYKNREGYPPLAISGKKLKGGKATIKGSVSSQFISALLLVAPYFELGLELAIEEDIVSKPYIDMTMEIMKAFGAEVSWQGHKINVKPVAYRYSKTAYAVESDWSAASYYYSFVALSPAGTKLSLKGLFKNSLQADAVCASIYTHFGVETHYSEEEILIIKTTDLTTPTFEYNFINCPDIAQTLVCTGIAMNRPFYFTGLQTLKTKETDRIEALKTELKKLDRVIEITANTMKYYSEAASINKKELIVSTYKDHRMAMSFAAFALLLDGIVIKDAEVVTKSYPTFWEDLNAIGIRTQLM
ncbi:MAG: 3-phosphoshikimate 1-carboxyvinyltransferase [Bacteroidota bacterium]